MREETYPVYYCPVCGNVIEGSLANIFPEPDKCYYCGTRMKITRDYIEKCSSAYSHIYYQGELMKFNLKEYYNLDKECIGYNGDMAHDLIRERLVYPNPEYSREKEEERHRKHEGILESNNFGGANAPKCPTCGSTSIRRMGGLERGTSVALFGLFSRKINKSFQCNNCGYTW